MDNPQQRPIVIERFYQALDEKTAATLTDAQKQDVEQAVLTITLTSRQRIDIRRSFPFFGRRYFYVFMAGRDMRRYPRHSSVAGRLLVSLLLVFALLFFLTSIFITLYLIKSALGIDIFNNFHVGLWTWLIDHQQ